MAETTEAPVGSYQLIGRVATTRTGTVWKARDPALERDVALKEVRRDPAALEALRQEARVLSTLDHPNLVTVYDLVEGDEGTGWLVEGWIEGAPLETVLDRCGTLSPPQAVGVIRGALCGLAHAHERGLVHGDVAPGNVLLTTEGTTVLIDFGLAGPRDSRVTTGTAGFVSPEALAGNHLAPASDVYSAAALLGFLLRGRPLFAGASEADVLATQARGTSPDLSGIGGRLAVAIGRGLAPDPGSRFPDATAFLAALDEAAEAEFGAGWLTSAGVAALVAAVGTAALLPIGAAAAPGSGAAALASHAGRVARTGGRIHRGLALKTAAGVVAVGAVAGVVVAATHKSGAPVQLRGSGVLVAKCDGCSTVQSDPAPARFDLMAIERPGHTYWVSLRSGWGDIDIYGFPAGTTVVQSGGPLGGGKRLEIGEASVPGSIDAFTISIAPAGTNSAGTPSSGRCVVTMVPTGSTGLSGSVSCPSLLPHGLVMPGEASYSATLTFSLSS